MKKGGPKRVVWDKIRTLLFTTKFYRIYEYCTQGRHDFMFIDMFPKEGLHPSPYRKNLDESDGARFVRREADERCASRVVIIKGLLLLRCGGAGRRPPGAR